ncbi:MAG: hypothetical protein OEY14_16020, partial [Myxococcales bacterium]|nr:hypothetical protein [Myxococcales bacterium]
VAGGSVNANTLDANCIGNVGAERNHVLTATAAFPSLRIMAGSQGDTTLVVQQPDGSYLCNDDTDMLNPVVPLSNAAAGDYRIWVGSIDPTATPAYTLGLTELDSVMPSAL